MSFVDMIMAGLKFDKAALNKIGKSDSDTGSALIMIFLNGILAGAIAYINDVPSTMGALLESFGDGAELAGIALLVFDFALTLLIYLLLGFILSLFIKMFGGTSSSMSVLRIIGATLIWSMLGSIASLFIGLGGILSLIGFIALIFGISAYSGKGMFVVFIALILSVIVLAILLGLLFIFVLLGLFAALI